MAGEAAKAGQRFGRELGRKREKPEAAMSENQKPQPVRRKDRSS
jgi:hypothetical protein